MEDILSDDDFPAPSGEVVAKGKYKLQVRSDKARIRAAKKGAGDRYLSLALAAVETAAGERVNSKLIYHTIPIEGVDKDGENKAKMFAAFFTALGFEKDDVRAMLANVRETAPSADEIGSSRDISIDITLNGEPVSLKDRLLMGSLKVEEYEDTESNKVSSVWSL